MRIPIAPLLLALSVTCFGCKDDSSEPQKRRFVPRIRTDGDCMLYCKRSGMCRAFEGRCIATEESHCRNSEDCDTRGRCTLQKPICVAADAGPAGPATAQPAKR